MNNLIINGKLMNLQSLSWFYSIFTNILKTVAVIFIQLTGSGSQYSSMVHYQSKLGMMNIVNFEDTIPIYHKEHNFSLRVEAQIYTTHQYKITTTFK